MRNILAIAVFSLLSITTACNKIRTCETENLTCNERPPSDELCQAYFVRWFYDETSNSCEEIGYSGCSQKGFTTQEDCEACLCDSK